MYIHMYPGHLVPLAVGNAHVTTGGSYGACPPTLMSCRPTPGLLSRPAYRMRVSVQGTTVQSVVPVPVPVFPMSCVTPAAAAARIPRAVHYRITVETSRKSHELHASSSSDEPEPRDKTALSMLVPLPSLSRRGESTTARGPCAGQTHIAHPPPRKAFGGLELGRLLRDIMTYMLPETVV